MISENNLPKLNYNDVKDWEAEDINAFLIKNFGAPLQINFPQHTAPIYNKEGIQLKDQAGRPRILHHMQVEALNAMTTGHIVLDPATTQSSEIAPFAHNLLASDVFITTQDKKMILELRTKFGPASQIAAGAVLISSGGFAKHDSEGLGDKPQQIALRETQEELGLIFSEQDFTKIHKEATAPAGLVGYPILTLENGVQFRGVRPTMGVQFLVQSFMNAQNILDVVRSNWENDALVEITLEDGVRLWSGETDSAPAKLYVSERIDKTTIQKAENIGDVFANAVQNTAERSVKHRVSPEAIDILLKRQDSEINGAQRYVKSLLSAAKIALGIN